MENINSGYTITPYSGLRHLKHGDFFKDAGDETRILMVLDQKQYSVYEAHQDDASFKLMKVCINVATLQEEKFPLDYEVLRIVPSEEEKVAMVPFMT